MLFFARASEGFCPGAVTIASLRTHGHVTIVRFRWKSTSTGRYMCESYLCIIYVRWDMRYQKWIAVDMICGYMWHVVIYALNIIIQIHCHSMLWSPCNIPQKVPFTPLYYPNHQLYSTGPVFHPDFSNLHFCFRKLISNSLCWYPTMTTTDFCRVLAPYPSSASHWMAYQALEIFLQRFYVVYADSSTSSQGCVYRMTQFQDVPSEWNLRTVHQL